MFSYLRGISEAERMDGRKYQTFCLRGRGTMIIVIATPFLFLYKILRCNPCRT